MAIDRTAETPGDGNPQANAKGRVYSMDNGSADEERIQVAGLRSCTFNIMMVIAICMGNPEPKPTFTPPRPPTVTIQSGGGGKK